MKSRAVLASSGVGRGMTWDNSTSRDFARRHWRTFAAIGVGLSSILAWGTFVFLWFAGNAQSSGPVPSTLGLWTTSNLVTFAFYAIFWELLAVVPPLALTAGVGWRWWKRLPEGERSGRRFGGRKGSTGGGLSILFFTAFCIKVFVDGKWNVPISSFTLDYVVGSLVVIFEWSLIVIGVPAAFALAWWISRARKPQSH